MRFGLLIAALLAIPLAASAQSASAPLTIGAGQPDPIPPLADLMAQFSEKVLEVERVSLPYLDWRSGFVLVLQSEPFPQYCRAQRVRLFTRHNAPQSFVEVDVETRYQTDSWDVPSDGWPRVCGDPRQGHWTLADDHQAFTSSRHYLAQINDVAIKDIPVASYPFRFICTRYGKPCDDPAAALKTIFADGIGKVGRDGPVVWASNPTNQHLPWLMQINTINPSPGVVTITTVTLDFTPPILS